MGLRLDGPDGVPAAAGPEPAHLGGRNLRGRIGGSDWLGLQHDGALGLVYGPQLVKPQLNRIGQTEKE